MDLKYNFKSVINREITHQYYVINRDYNFESLPSPNLDLIVNSLSYDFQFRSFAGLDLGGVNEE